MEAISSHSINNKWGACMHPWNLLSTMETVGGNSNDVFLAHVYAKSHVARGLFSQSDGQILSRGHESAG